MAITGAWLVQRLTLQALRPLIAVLVIAVAMVATAMP
jgi:uncharacterized membrane protein YfcA